MIQVILASQSPRRKELLTQIGMEFVVCPSTIEENVTDTNPVEVVKELSRQKAEDIAGRTESNDIGKDFLVIGADTIVVYDEKILGKPVDEADAIRMLTMLQGKTHSVFTGVTLVLNRDTRKVITFAEKTEVVMCPMSQEEITWYVGTGEPMDKAGAYGIQGLCARFIREIRGDYNNVVGLPVGRIYQELKEQGGIV